MRNSSNDTMLIERGTGVILASSHARSIVLRAYMGIVIATALWFKSGMVVNDDVSTKPLNLIEMMAISIELAFLPCVAVATNRTVKQLGIVIFAGFTLYGVYNLLNGIECRCFGESRFSAWAPVVSFLSLLVSFWLPTNPLASGTQNGINELAIVVVAAAVFQPFIWSVNSIAQDWRQRTLVQDPELIVGKDVSSFVDQSLDQYLEVVQFVMVVKADCARCEKFQKNDLIVEKLKGKSVLILQHLGNGKMDVFNSSHYDLDRKLALNCQAGITRLAVYPLLFEVHGSVIRGCIQEKDLKED